MTINKPRAVTAQYDFCPATANGDKLFSVRAGIPLSDAFNELSLLLAASQSAVEGSVTAANAGDVPDAQWAAVHLMNFTYALVQAMHKGLNDSEREDA